MKDAEERERLKRDALKREKARVTERVAQSRQRKRKLQKEVEFLEELNGKLKEKVMNVRRECEID